MDDAPRMLAVDDDPEILEWFSAIYRGEFDLHTHLSIAEGLEATRSERFDVIILDIDFPEGSGLDILEKVRTDPAHAVNRDTPVVMLTASKRATDYETSWELGSIAYVPKPLDIERLRNAIDHALSGA